MAKNIGAMLTHEDILQAAGKIEKDAIKLSQASKFAVIVKGKSYPPTEIVKIASKMKGLKIENYRLSGGKSINNHLKRLGFEVNEKDKIADPIAQLIERYKEHIKTNKLADEIYKWELVEENKGKPNLDAEDFEKEIRSIHLGNLVYAMAGAVLHRLAKEKPEKLRLFFKDLFDENKSLEKRVHDFNMGTLGLYREIEGKLSHHQDERTISTYLTYYNPKKYTFYKNSYYQKYCKLLKIQQKETGSKLTHYLDLLKDLIENYIVTDSKLIEQVKSYIPQYDGKNHLLLAQDILYQMLDKTAKEDVESFEIVKSKFKEEDLEAYFSFLRGIIQKFNLQKGDKRLVFSIANNSLNFEIGQRYCWNLLNANSKGRFGVISKVKLFPDSDSFTGKSKDYYYNYYNEIKFSNEEKDSTFNAISEQLKRTNKSSYYKHNNIDFENYVFENSSITNKKTKQMIFPLNQILYGPPGTGKTYNTIVKAAEIIENRTINDFFEAKEIFNKHLGDRIEFITFHQNYSYEDFIQGLRPDVDNDTSLTFDRKDGIFKMISDKALKNILSSEKPQENKKSFEEVFNTFFSPLLEGEEEELEIPMKKVSFYVTGISNKSIDFRKTNGDTSHTLSIATLKRMYEAESVLDMQGLASYYTPLLSKLLSIGKISDGKKEIIQKQNYVIVIDEINRANISRVFGELITLIEPDKRSHGEIPLKSTLPSGEEFVVPSNLYIIGTMNTADKSIALLDIALRRRFEFVAMYPKYFIDGHDIYDVDILEKLNKKIIEKKGHDFQIGHSYFMGENKDLKKRLNVKVIPLLLEYFMNDKTEVKEILNHAGLEIEPDSWPLRIIGKRDQPI